jgi:lipopolysaccharide export system protein LptA
MRFFLVLLLGGLLASGVAEAKPATPAARAPAADETLEVTADQSLEWYQAQHLYVARGNAKAVRGDVTFEADILSAHAREAEDGGSVHKDTKNNKSVQASKPSGETTSGEAGEMGSIDRLMAEGNVRITDPRQQVFGDRAVYDLDRRVATVTGDHLKYVTANKDVVTARESMDYFEDKDIAVARGNARATRADGRRIEADQLTAHFTVDAQGQKEMSTMTAEGHVVVYAGGDVARGNHAVYDAKKNVAVLTGHVQITREDTQLAGDRAEVDFAAGQSRLVNTGGGRVRALLPGKAAAATRAPAPSKGAAS